MSTEPPRQVIALDIRSLRTTIRNRIVARLAEVTGTDGQGRSIYRTGAGAHVFTGRVKRLFPKDLPALLVYGRDEPIPGDPEGHSITGQDGSMTRDLALVVEGAAVASTDIDDVLDVLGAQIEAALDEYEIPELPSATLRLERTELDVDAEAETPVGGVKLTWRIRYRTAWRVQPDGPPPPTRVFLGFAPNTGLDHLADYVQIAGPPENPPP